ncbi:hypothetical protein QBC32DRAFT_58841 [Pseudoneurospora amorphoporcata]|uniref:Uncharacterized protein n=1 Tax=Pseudoneurospora amorphoporcata TaxID=241081 RepID=A0AAN6NRE0_9PEZI|nr:hypothetical protein QBC32DRAFT_58841 [Pseudoneurospora amorphoporcata]
MVMDGGWSGWRNKANSYPKSPFWGPFSQGLTVATVPLVLNPHPATYNNFLLRISSNNQEFIIRIIYATLTLHCSYVLPPYVTKPLASTAC